MSKDFALAYNMKKRASKKDDDMDNDDDTPEVPANVTGGYSDGGLIGKIGKLIPLAMMAMAEGGEVEKPEMDDDDVICRIMKERRGDDDGDGDELADADSNDFDATHEEEVPDFHETGANSGDEIGDEEQDEERRDIIDEIMRARKKKA